MKTITIYHKDKSLIIYEDVAKVFRLTDKQEVKSFPFFMDIMKSNAEYGISMLKAHFNIPRSFSPHALQGKQKL